MRFRALLLLAALPLVSASCTHIAFYRGGAMISHDPPPVELTPARQGMRGSCALVCLETVLDYWGDGVGREELRRRLGEMPDEGYTLGQLRALAREMGLEAFIVEGDISFLRKHTRAGRPVIVVLRHGNNNHSVVVAGVEERKAVIVMDPAPGEMLKISMPAFLERWERAGCPALLIAPAG